MIKEMLNTQWIIQQLIRPVRFTYSPMELGPSVFTLEQQGYQRQDFTTRAHPRVHASYFHPRGKSVSTILIYLHCNCGSRVQGMQFVHEALRGGFGFVCYDSRACGHSEGEYISLGYHEVKDLQAVIEWLEGQCSNVSFILWGRSMGAVTTIRYLSNRHENVVVAILDSPFIDVKQVIYEMVKQRIGAPQIIVDLFLQYLEPTIRQKANFSLTDLNVRTQIENIRTPLIIVGSKADGLVPFAQLEEIYEKHPGKKSLFYLQQSHTEKRTKQTIGKIFKSIQRYYLNEINTIRTHSKSMSMVKSSMTTPSKKRIQLISTPAHHNFQSAEKKEALKKRKTYLKTCTKEQKQNDSRKSFHKKEYNFSTPQPLQKNIVNLQKCVKLTELKLN